MIYAISPQLLNHCNQVHTIQKTLFKLNGKSFVAQTRATKTPNFTLIYDKLTGMKFSLSELCIRH